MRVFESLDEFTGQVGQELGSSDWKEVTQEAVNQFADATGDHQWIHVDVERSKSGPFGAPIAHGYMTLAQVPDLAGQIYQVDGITMAINYGANKVRFPSPVIVGSKVRAHAKLLETSERSQGIQAVIEVTIEQDGAEKPACVAETLVLFVP